MNYKTLFQCGTVSVITNAVLLIPALQGSYIQGTILANIVCLLLPIGVERIRYR